ncbi:MAG: B12-binding domain-containing radical SAM protein [Bacteroidales bacterium]
MKILLIYPKYPDTFWSFKHALRFISKKAAIPPLGLITVSAMLPESWQKKLVDMNTNELYDQDIIWADYVFLSAMYIQRESVDRVIDRCLKNKVKIVAGGPLFTQDYLNYPQIDHFVLNEAEITLAPFIQDIEDEKKPERIYQTTEYADITKTPVPDYHLLSLKHYATMSLQITRGCPFACDFCEITSLLGHKVRMKDTSQVLREMDALYKLNWRGTVAVVDDNFIGNKREIKENLLPAMKQWMKAHQYPFLFTSQVSINLADDEELLSEMVKAGFGSAFIGIETPDEISLHGCHKVQNENRDLLGAVKKIQRAGIDVSAGFIIGFDSDTQTIFQRQTDFIQQSGIVSAMVGLLNAPKNTKLYQRLEAENRLTVDASGSNTDGSMNFVPAMDEHILMNGYKSVIQSIYAVKPYYQRLRMFLRNYQPRKARPKKVGFAGIKSLLKTVIVIGMINSGRLEYWKMLAWTLFRRPALFMDSMTYVVYGYHYRKVYGLNRIIE